MAEKHEHEVEIEQEPDKGLHCSFLHSEVILTPPSPWPFRSFAGETIIVTGSGLGYEAARHFYRLDCAKLILAVRTVARGNEAKHNIIHSVRHRTDGASAIKVWHLDLFSTGSTLAFTKRVTNKLDRVDRLIENADISPTHFDLVEGVESTIQVNVLNTLLLALLLLPKLRETKVKFPTAQPHLTIVSSEVQNFKAVPESRAWDLYSSLSDDKTSRMCTRYQLSKLIGALFVREFVARMAMSKTNYPHVTINMANPGRGKGNFADKVTDALTGTIGFGHWIAADRTEVGLGALLAGATGGLLSHGQFLSDSKIIQAASWIYSERGQRLQEKVYEQTMMMLQQRKPGIERDLGVAVTEG